MGDLQILLIVLACTISFCDSSYNFDSPSPWHSWPSRSSHEAWIRKYYMPHDIPHKRPHIVFMLIDDLGWGDVSFHGSKQIPTPNVDALARDGIILNQYYVQSICSPSRGALMTGKYAMRIGFQNSVIRGQEPWGLPLEERILPQYLKSLGYSTHAVGKWHLGFFKKDYLPRARGFDTFFGYYNGLEDYFTHVSISDGIYEGLDLRDNEKVVYHFNGTYGTDLFTDKAKQVITNHDPAQPLFLYLAQQAVHSGNFNTKPLECPDRYYKKMVGIDDRNRTIYAGMVSAMDQSVGEIFATLERTGMLDDTIFILSTDNGGISKENGKSSGSNFPLKGAKYTLWEGGTRGTAFIWSPRLRLHSRIHNDFIHITDWLPTLLDAAGGPWALRMLPSEIDGINQWPSLSRSLPSPRSEILLNLDHKEGVEGIRKGRFKLVKGTYYNGAYDKWYDQEGRVFNYSYSRHTPEQKTLYEENYQQFLKRSKVAEILQRKYGRDPRLASSCSTLECKMQLEIQCGLPPPSWNASGCDAVNRETCLFDVVHDPCEYHNVAKLYPEVVADLKLAVDKYRKFEVPSGEPPGDPESDPKLHGGVWIPWQSCNE